MRKLVGVGDSVFAVGCHSLKSKYSSGSGEKF